jgi:4-amino-4-deoxy-L-arabinose transferase-like glycosyltransferase
MARCAGAVQRVNSGPVPAKTKNATAGATRQIRPADAAVLIALGAAVFGFHIGSYRLWEPDEARYAEIAREMIALGNYLLPHLNFVPYVEKPPLLYWMIALSMRTAGFNETAARIPGAICALAGALATWFFTLRTFDRRRALIAGAILITAPLYAVMAQVVTTDMALTTLTAIAMFALFLQWREGGRWYVIGYIAIGLGILAKGPVSAAIPILVMIVFAWREHGLRGAAARLHVVTGAFVTAVIAAPWFVYMTVKMPDFFSFYFIDEHVRRFLDSSYSHGGPIWFYIPVLIAGLIPWSLLAPFLPWRPSEPNAARRFCTIAALTIFGFFSISRSKLIPYMMPALPAIAVLLADAIGRAASAAPTERSDAERSPTRLLVASPLLGLIGAAAITTAILAPDSSSPYLTLVQPALFALGAVTLLGGMATAVSFRLGGAFAGLTVLVITMVAALWAGSYGRLEAEPLRSYAALSEEIAASAPDATIVCYGRYVQAVPFYTRRRAIVIGAKTELTFGADHASDARDWFFEGASALLRLWRGNRRIVVVLDERDLARLAPKLGAFNVIGSEWHKRAILKKGDDAVGG